MDEWPPFFEKLEAGTASDTQQLPLDFEKLAEEVGTPLVTTLNTPYWKKIITFVA